MNFINTPERFQTLLADLLKKAKQSGADAAEAGIEESAALEVSVRRGKLDNMDMNREQALSLTVFAGGKTGTATTAAITPEAMQTVVERALAIARATSPDPHAGLADPDLMATNLPDLDLYHPWHITPEAAIAIAQRAEAAALAAHPAISEEKSDGAAVSTQTALTAYANTHGFSAYETSSEHDISASALAQDPASPNGAMETDGWSESAVCADSLPSPEEIGEQAGARAARRLGGGKISDCRASVIFQAPAAHSLIRHFIGAASGGALYRNTSFLRGKLGQQIFADSFTLQERPYLPRQLASAAYDADGVATQTRDVVKDGVWHGCFLSAYSARKLGMTSTGNAGGAHNLEVVISPAATVAAAHLPRQMQRGLIVTDLMGQGANPVTGDYSRGAAGFWVENGQIVYPVSEVTIAGNLLAMFAAIAAAGDDAMRRGGILCGSLLIPDMIIGGNK